MHVVFLNQFYPPDVLPTGVVLEAVAEELVAQGHEVTVVAGKASVVSPRLSGESLGPGKELGRSYGGAHAPPGVPPGAAPGDAPPEKSSSDQSDPQTRREPIGNPLCDSGSRGARQTGKAVQVVRLWAPGWGNRKSALGKILSYASYYAGVAWWLLSMRRRHRADVIVALTTPPYLSLLARMGAGWHGARHAHWVMDLYPDVMVAHGMLREGGMGERILTGLARWGMGGKRSGPVLTLGPDMADRLGRYLPEGRKAAWVPLWGTAEGAADDRAVAALREHRGWEPDTTVFLYSGNMGLGHRFTEVIGALPRLVAAHPERKIHLAFYGGGKRHGEIKAALAGLEALETGGGFEEGNSAGASSTAVETNSAGASSTAVERNSAGASSTPLASLSGYVPQEELAAHLASGEVHLASLDPAWDGMMVPSKLQGIFAAGRPVLFTGSRTCSIGRWILESGGGWVCAPDDVEAHVQAMREALDPVERHQRGAAARAFAAGGFDRGRNVQRIVEWWVVGS